MEPDIPYDEKKGIVPNVNGKVEPGLYCAGWLATGPRGVIVDTMTEAFRVGQVVANDLATETSDLPKDGFAQIETILKSRSVRSVSFEDWRKIDSAEKENGENFGKPREKFTNVNDMISTLE